MKAEEIGVSLTTLQKVEKLQSALHAKAKGSSAFRFYSLYDKICCKDVLWVAYWRCQSNGGSEGVDGQTFKDIEVYGNYVASAIMWLTPHRCLFFQGEALILTT